MNDGSPVEGESGAAGCGFGAAGTGGVDGVDGVVAVDCPAHGNAQQKRQAQITKLQRGNTCIVAYIARKLRIIWWPPSVSTLSGWNCTPSMGSVL